MKTNELEGALGCYRVLDLTDIKGHFCGKLLGDLGADVIKVEPPGGDSSRKMGPFYNDIPDKEKNLTWFAYNMNKRGITLDLETEEGQSILKELVKTADMLVESYDPGTMEQNNLDFTELKALNPKLVMASITHFGQTGPYSGYKGSGLVDSALGDTMFATGDPDRAPLQISHHPQSYCHGSAEAAAAMTMACYDAQKTGEGQYIDVSLQECMAWTAADVIPYWDISRGLIPRQGAKRFRPDTGVYFKTLWECGDGYVTYPYLGGSIGARSNRAIVNWMIEEGFDVGYLKDIIWEEFDWATMTQESTDERERITAIFFNAHTKAELFEGALQRRVMLYPVATPADMLLFKQLDARNFWVSVHHPELDADITYPGAWGVFSRTPCQIRCKAPLIGEHNKAIYTDELGKSPDELEILKQKGVI